MGTFLSVVGGLLFVLCLIGIGSLIGKLHDKIDCIQSQTKTLIECLKTQEKRLEILREEIMELEKFVKGMES